MQKILTTDDTQQGYQLNFLAISLEADYAAASMQ